jgi:DNA-binding transcriptional LysR family regulator
MESTPAWDDLRVLLALHRQGSLLGAGRALGTSTSTVARRISALEEGLQCVLVQRTRSGSSLEPRALELVALAEQFELGLSAARRAPSSTLTGTVRLSMGEGFVQPVTRILGELRRRHPAITIELVSEARLTDLARREADVAIRVARSRSSVLVERTAGRLRFSLYAASSYLDRRLRGGRLEPTDLPHHDVLGYLGLPAQGAQQRWLEAQGVERFVLKTNSDVALGQAVADGQGLAVLPDALARELPVERVSYPHAPPVTPVYLAFHRGLRTEPRIRAVVSALGEALRSALV